MNILANILASVVVAGLLVLNIIQGDILGIVLMSVFLVIEGILLYIQIQISRKD